jgi:hypothetical protein
MSKLYFKVINFYKSELAIVPEKIKSMQEYEAEYNWELKNDYFENARFYSDSEIEWIQFQVFFTKHAYFRYPEFYNDPLKIQDYYKNKYQTPFFFSLSDDELRKKYHPSFQLGKYLDFEDFKSIILPNFKLNLICIINKDELEDKLYYIFYNWDFFEEVHISPFSNSFLNYLDYLPFGSRHNSYEIEVMAKISAINALLENACSTVDTTLKGLSFDMGDFKSELFAKGKYIGKVVPKIRHLREIGNESEIMNNPDFHQDLDNCLKIMEENTMKPFEIKTNANLEASCRTG